MGDKKEKGKLILGNKIEPVEQMTFTGPSRPNPDVERKLGTKDTGFKDVKFPELPPDSGTYEEFLGSNEYRSALDKLEQLTGSRNVGVGVSDEYITLHSQASRLLLELQQVESTRKDRLISLCEQIIRQYTKINENELQFDFKLSETPIAVKKKRPQQQQPQNQQAEEELVNDINGLTKERAKRRLVNAMIQGHAVNDVHLFQSAAEQLEQVTGVRNVAQKYSIVMSAILLGYWQLPESTLSAVMGDGDDDGSGAGKTRVDTSTRPPTIHAEGLLFPFLVHEAIKGVMEYLSMEKKPQNPERYDIARKMEDKPEKEPDDIRLGPEIWRRLMRSLPNDVTGDPEKKKLVYHMYVNIVNLPPKEFLVLMNEILSQSESAKRLLGAMYYDLSVRKDEGMTKRESQFKPLLDSMVAAYDDEDIEDFMSDTGISWN